MTAAATGVDHSEVFETLRPTFKLAPCWCAVISPTQIFHFDRGLARWHACTARWPLNAVPRAPPRPDGVVQEELHHVMLGEELCDGRERATVDLFTTIVDLILPLRLPELVHPAEAVICQERLSWQAGQ